MIYIYHTYTCIHIPNIPMSSLSARRASSISVKTCCPRKKSACIPYACTLCLDSLC